MVVVEVVVVREEQASISAELRGHQKLGREDRGFPDEVGVLTRTILRSVALREDVQESSEVLSPSLSAVELSGELICRSP